ncbi:hypothetical protein [uncultured Tenacibaculum sp.]|uniref:hypothetical protein n=1 Tax=uncultured Tenacibaculum sp. TaxID=174713 RepID=UPI0026210CE9|nr:hypothetical protein [uncultured Tenacibaculum sp.]
MKKSILNLGKTINKAEQKEINGGSGHNGWQCCSRSSKLCGTCVYTTNNNCSGTYGEDIFAQPCTVKTKASFTDV